MTAALARQPGRPALALVPAPDAEHTRDLAVLDAARAANVGAALSVGQVGARGGMPTAEAIKTGM